MARPEKKTALQPAQEDNGQFSWRDPGNAKLAADVEQFLCFHRNADLTAEVLQVRLLFAILKRLDSALQR